MTSRNRNVNVIPPAPILINVTSGQSGGRGVQGISGLTIQGTQGLTGPQGLQGTAGSVESVSFVYNQNTSSDTWIINHNLNFYRNVTFQDSGGTIVEGEIQYTTRNTLTATFSAAFSGSAYLS